MSSVVIGQKRPKVVAFVGNGFSIHMWNEVAKDTGVRCPFLPPYFHPDRRVERWCTPAGPAPDMAGNPWDPQRIPLITALGEKTGWDDDAMLSEIAISCMIEVPQRR